MHVIRLARTCLTALAVAVIFASPETPAAAPAGRRQPRPPVPHLVVDATTKLLVVAPHPDDEVLGAGGLMQRVHAAGGKVRVVYLTDGDGYPEGVRVEDHIDSPTPSDYRGYGQQRKREAREALKTLGLPKASATFLSFPDGGLCQLITTYWSERRASFRSPYTRRDRPPKGDIIVPHTAYRGEDLTQELARVITAFQPTLILLPRKEDQHGDHCAAWFFTKDALTDVERVHPEYEPDVLNYIVHWYAWPFEEESASLSSPPGLRGGTVGWISVPLTTAQQRTKRQALQQFHTQVHVMDWFLDGFARSNEVFSRPAPRRVVLPLRRSPCCE